MSGLATQAGMFISVSGEFSPSSLTGLRAWIDMADGKSVATLSGLGTIGSVTDMSGNGNTLVSDGTREPDLIADSPVAGLRVMDFNSNDHLYWESGEGVEAGKGIYAFIACEVTPGTLANIASHAVGSYRNGSTQQRGMWDIFKDSNDDMVAITQLTTDGFADPVRVTGGAATLGWWVFALIAHRNTPINKTHFLLTDDGTTRSSFESAGYIDDELAHAGYRETVSSRIGTTGATFQNGYGWEGPVGEVIIVSGNMTGDSTSGQIGDTMNYLRNKWL